MDGVRCIIESMIETSSLKITQEILGSIAEIDEFKGTWHTLGTLAPERLNDLRNLATIESVGASTRIEGSKLSDSEVKKLLSGSKHFETRDEQEVAGYAEVMELIFESWQDIGLSENHIKQLHSNLLKYSERDSRHRGEYKTSPNKIAAFDETGKQMGTIFETASPFETPTLMNEVVVWTNEALETRSFHPLVAIAIFVVVFLVIHPFQDGNGRLSRVLTSLLILRSGYAWMPYSSLEAVIERNKEGYYWALYQTQKTIRTDLPNWQPWITYFLQTLLEQSRNLAKKVEREKVLLASLPQLSLQILEHAKQQGRVSVADMTKITGISRNTIKDHLKALCQKNHLVLRGKGRGSWYELV